MTLDNRLVSCSEKTRAPIIKIFDPLSKDIKINLLNCDRREFIKTRYDGCVVAQTAAADYLLIEKETSNILIVELKGSNISRAFEQIEATLAFINQPDNTFLFERKQTGALIVCRQRPHGPHAQVLQNRFFLKHRLVTHVYTSAKDIEFDAMLTVPPRTLAKKRRRSAPKDWHKALERKQKDR